MEDLKEELCETTRKTNTIKRSGSP